MDKKNGLAWVLMVFGWIIMGIGLIFGLYFGDSHDFIIYGPEQGLIALGIVLQGLIIGLIFLGISEILHLLQKINNTR